MSRTALAALLLSTVAVTQTPTPTHGTAPVVLHFGVYTSDQSTAMYQQFAPLTRALEDSLAKLLDQPANVKLKIYATYEMAQDALVADQVDFVRFGPASYVLAKERNPKLKLLVMERKNGQKTFKGYIVVPKASAARSVADLRGKRFAFGDPDSTIGRYLAQQILLDADITAADLGKVEYLGRHDKVFRAVELGDFDAGALKSGTFTKLNTKGQLRILASFDNVTKPWVARSQLPDRLRDALRAALLTLDDQTALTALDVDRLVVTSDSDYDNIRAAMRSTTRFQPPAAGPDKD